MPPVVFSGGCNEVENPTLLPAEVLVEATGLEYRVGRAGIYTVRGRELHGTISATARAIYSLGFDGANEHILVQAADSYYTGLIQSGISFSAGLNVGSGTGRLSGTHMANRHYIVNGNQNLAVENLSGVSTRTIGMAAATATLGLSVSATAGNMTASVGLVYWVTEYDSSRGIESVAGATSFTNQFTSVAAVVASISGVSVNSNMDTFRVYRSTDGGTFPDGGLIGTIPASGTALTDSSTDTTSLSVPLYGTISIGGLDFDRDVRPPTLYAIGSYQNSLVGFAQDDPRAIRFTPAGYPESWPTGYFIPLTTARQDVGVGFAELNGMLGAFTQDTVHRVTRLPREVDNAFAAGEVSHVIEESRGAVAASAITTFTMPGRGPLIAFVSRDAVCVTDLFAVEPVTDGVAWESRVSASRLSRSSLANDPLNRRLVFTYWKVSDSDYPTGVMYLDYQAGAFRITHPDHGSLSAICLATHDGVLRLFSADGRVDNGSVYTEASVDPDGSLLFNSSGRMNNRLITSTQLPAGSAKTARLGDVTWMHDAAGTGTTVSFGFTRNQLATEYRQPDFSSDEATNFPLNREVNSYGYELAAASNTAWGIHWVDTEIPEVAELGGRRGA